MLCIAFARKLPEPDLTASIIPITQLSLAKTALFFDFDGTLAQIIADPDRVCVTSGTHMALGRLDQATGGALAIISGRSIAQIDAMLDPLRFPAAGVHGLERRNAAGKMMRETIEPAAEQRLARLVNAFVRERKGLLAEVKPGSIALHYRNHPELATDCHDFAESLVRNNDHITLVAGKMVVELKLSPRNKGDAIVDFMAEAPFYGRQPFFAGDDVTDEAGFVLVNALGGVSLKIGPGKTAAHYRFEDRKVFALWLQSLAGV